MCDGVRNKINTANIKEIPRISPCVVHCGIIGLDCRWTVECDEVTDIKLDRIEVVGLIDWEGKWYCGDGSLKTDARYIKDIWDGSRDMWALWRRKAEIWRWQQCWVVNRGWPQNSEFVEKMNGWGLDFFAQGFSMVVRRKTKSLSPGQTAHDSPW